VSDHPHRARRVVARGTVSVAVVLALSGALFAANAKFAEASAERHPQDLDDLAQVELERVDALTDQVDTLHSDVDDLAADANRSNGTTVGSPSAAYLVESGSTPVTGEGLTVRLDDAPADSRLRTDVEPDTLVVHQQDLQAVMNALWQGGAEAMSLMDQRVVSTSAFRCIGNVLQLHGLSYSPPYEVRAIGDPDLLRAALDASPDVAGYQRDASRVGLGWDVRSGRLELPAYAGATDLAAAEVPEGTPILPGLPSATDPSRGRDEPASGPGTVTE
jgi:uncharacterized protein YlxW (UPF0749 family)